MPAHTRTDVEDGPRNPPYRPISDYGVVGDCRTAALVSSEGSVDWWCLPRFDGPSVFARILDARQGGHFELRPLDRYVRTVVYEDGTNVLRTRYRCPHGDATVHDFMPVAEGVGPAADESRLLRVVRCTRGRVRFGLAFHPRFTYGRESAAFRKTSKGVRATGSEQHLCLRVDTGLEEREGGLFGSLELRAGETRTVAAGPTRTPEALPGNPDGPDLLEATMARWRRWSGKTRYEGPYRSQVLRSVLTLKLLTYAPTGAVVAAPTTSLPENLGGVRNWDYRYTWSRDAVFTVAALHDVGHPDSAYRFADWVAAEVQRADIDHLPIILTVTGGDPVAERELPHLEGYRGSGPVRVGNRAAHQHQLDVYGETLDSLHLCRLLGTDHEARVWGVLSRMVDWVCDHWHEPDHGIWEVRSEPKHFVHSKVMAWTALDRGVRAVEECGLEGPVERWREVRDVVWEEVLERGYDPDVQAFTQTYGGRHPDAANLLIPLVGFLPAHDPRVESTVDFLVDRLGADGLLYRYMGTDDGVPGSEAAFTVCSFWLVQVLAEMGRFEQAERVLDAIARRASPLGLFAEEIEAFTGDHRGNYPHALPHLGLLNATLALARGRDPGAQALSRQRVAADSPSP